MVRVLTLALALLATSAPLSAQQALPDSLPRFMFAGRDTQTVAGAILELQPVIPLDAAFAALGAPLTSADSGRALSVRFPSHVLRLRARNPFVVVTDSRSGQSSLLQLPTAPATFGGRMFAGLPGLALLLRGVVPGDVELDSSRSLTVTDTSALVPLFDITRLDVEQRLNGYLMTIRATRKLGAVETWLKPDGWLFVTIEGARADTVQVQNTRLFGAIRKVLVFQSPTSVQLTVKVAPDVEAAEVVPDPSSFDLMVTLRTRSTSERQDLDRRRQTMAEKDLSKQRDKWKLDVIVIDPGHGGKDPGTIGLNGTYEKTVTLAVGLRLAELLRKELPGVKVMMTRSTDKFVELYRRTQLANEAGGKLFVSIHCNAMDKKPSRQNGFEIYLLRPGKTDDAVRIAARENAVIQLEEDRDRYKELTEEEFILVTMAQSASVRNSERFASIAAEAMDKHTTLRVGGVKQAGFYVLVGASMPNALVETGYLSNKKDEAILRSKDGQSKIARALFEGIREYKTHYERDLREGYGFRTVPPATSLGARPSEPPQF